MTDSSRLTFYQGYLALGERIRLIQTRMDSDPFVADLRELEQRIFLLQNGGRMLRLRRLLEDLNNSPDVRLAQYDLVDASGKEHFFES